MTRILVSEELRSSAALAAAKRKTVSLSVVPGTLTVAAGLMRWYNDTGVDLSVVSTRASVVTAPTGAALIVDVKLSGTSIFAITTANRPTVAISGNTAVGGTPDTTVVPAGGYLTADVTQIGSGTAGAGLHVQAVLAPVAN